MQCEEWADANSELFKEAHDETVHKNSYKRKLYELISASLVPKGVCFQRAKPGCEGFPFCEAELQNSSLRRSDTTTLTAAGCVKLQNLKNPRGQSPVNPHAEVVSFEPWGRKAAPLIRDAARDP